MTECDCVGPNARTSTGECRVMAEFRVIRQLQIRRSEGEVPTPEEVDALCVAAGLDAPSDAYRRAREERERDTDGQGMEWRLQRLGVPTVALMALRRLQDTQAMDAAKKAHAIPAEMCPFLALMGETGQGKTVAAAWFFREMARRTSPDLPTGSTEPLVWVSGSMFSRVGAFSADDTAALEKCRRARLLVVDELGHEATGIGASAVRDLLLQREANGRRTVLTSNLNAAEFRDKYGAALLDRLLNRGVCVNLKGKSMRLRESMRGGGR